MVIDNAYKLRVCESYITLADLTVDSDEKIGTSRVVRRISYGNIEIRDHYNEVALLDGIIAPVNEFGGFAVVLQVCIKCESRGQSIGIRVIVALDNYIVIF
jgi:hypothetical protein